MPTPQWMPPAYPAILASEHVYIRIFLKKKENNTYLRYLRAERGEAACEPASEKAHAAHVASDRITRDSTAPRLLSTIAPRRKYEYRSIDASPYRYVRRFIFRSSPLDSIRIPDQKSPIWSTSIQSPSSLVPTTTTFPDPQTDHTGGGGARRLMCNL